VDADNNLTDINERTSISGMKMERSLMKMPAVCMRFREDSLVSMNYLCFHPSFIDVCEEQFGEFLDQHINEPKAEFFIPTATKYFIQSGKGNVKVIPTSAKWFGVTYKEDAPGVQASIEALVESRGVPGQFVGRS
jgi:hypothetical protein